MSQSTIAFSDSTKFLSVDPLFQQPKRDKKNMQRLNVKDFCCVCVCNVYAEREQMWHKLYYNAYNIQDETAIIHMKIDEDGERKSTQ